MDKEALFNRPRPEDKVEVPGLGTFTVRGLTRAEVHRFMAAQQAGGSEAGERVALRYGLVDPPLTEAEVARWIEEAGFEDVEPVCSKILDLSGLLPEAAKEAYKRFRGEPGA